MGGSAIIKYVPIFVNVKNRKFLPFGLNHAAIDDTSTTKCSIRSDVGIADRFRLEQNEIDLLKKSFDEYKTIGNGVVKQQRTTFCGLLEKMINSVQSNDTLNIDSLFHIAEDNFAQYKEFVGLLIRKIVSDDENANVFYKILLVLNMNTIAPTNLPQITSYCNAIGFFLNFDTINIMKEAISCVKSTFGVEVTEIQIRKNLKYLHNATLRTVIQSVPINVNGFTRADVDEFLNFYSDTLSVCSDDAEKLNKVFKCYRMRAIEKFSQNQTVAKEKVESIYNATSIEELESQIKDFANKSIINAALTVKILVLKGYSNFAVYSNTDELDSKLTYERIIGFIEDEKMSEVLKKYKDLDFYNNSIDTFVALKKYWNKKLGELSSDELDEFINVIAKLNNAADQAQDEQLANLNEILNHFKECLEKVVNDDEKKMISFFRNDECSLDDVKDFKNMIDSIKDAKSKKDEIQASPIDPFKKKTAMSKIDESLPKIKISQVRIIVTVYLGCVINISADDYSEVYDAFKQRFLNEIKSQYGEEGCEFFAKYWQIRIEYSDDEKKKEFLKECEKIENIYQQRDFKIYLEKCGFLKFYFEQLVDKQDETAAAVYKLANFSNNEVKDIIKYVFELKSYMSLKSLSNPDESQRIQIQHFEMCFKIYGGFDKWLTLVETNIGESRLNGCQFRYVLKLFSSSWEEICQDEKLKETFWMFFCCVEPKEFSKAIYGHFFNDDPDTVKLGSAVYSLSHSKETTFETFFYNCYYVYLCDSDDCENPWCKKFFLMYGGKSKWEDTVKFCRFNESFSNYRVGDIAKLYDATWQAICQNSEKSMLFKTICTTIECPQFKEWFFESFLSQCPEYKKIICLAYKTAITIKEVEEFVEFFVDKKKSFEETDVKIVENINSFFGDADSCLDCIQGNISDKLSQLVGDCTLKEIFILLSKEFEHIAKDEELSKKFVAVCVAPESSLKECIVKRICCSGDIQKVICLAYKSSITEREVHEFVKLFADKINSNNETDVEIMKKICSFFGDEAKCSNKIQENIGHILSSQLGGCTFKEIIILLSDQFENIVKNEELKKKLLTIYLGPDSLLKNIIIAKHFTCDKKNLRGIYDFACVLNKPDASGYDLSESIVAFASIELKPRSEDKFFFDYEKKLYLDRFRILLGKGPVVNTLNIPSSLDNLAFRNEHAIVEGEGKRKYTECWVDDILTLFSCSWEEISKSQKLLGIVKNILVYRAGCHCAEVVEAHFFNNHSEELWTVIKEIEALTLEQEFDISEFYESFVPIVEIIRDGKNINAMSLDDRVKVMGENIPLSPNEITREKLIKYKVLERILMLYGGEKAWLESVSKKVKGDFTLDYDFKEVVVLFSSNWEEICKNDELKRMFNRFYFEKSANEEECCVDVRKTALEEHFFKSTVANKIYRRFFSLFYNKELSLEKVCKYVFFLKKVLFLKDNIQRNKTNEHADEVCLFEDLFGECYSEEDEKNKILIIKKELALFDNMVMFFGGEQKFKESVEYNIENVFPEEYRGISAMSLLFPQANDTVDDKQRTKFIKYINDHSGSLTEDIPERYFLTADNAGVFEKCEAFCESVRAKINENDASVFLDIEKFCEELSPNSKLETMRCICRIYCNDSEYQSFSEEYDELKKYFLNKAYKTLLVVSRRQMLNKFIEGEIFDFRKTIDFIKWQPSGMETESFDMLQRIKRVKKQIEMIKNTDEFLGTLKQIDISNADDIQSFRDLLFVVNVVELNDEMEPQDVISLTKVFATLIQKLTEMSELLLHASDVNAIAQNVKEIRTVIDNTPKLANFVLQFFPVVPIFNLILRHIQVGGNEYVEYFQENKKMDLKEPLRTLTDEFMTLLGSDSPCEEDTQTECFASSFTATFVSRRIFEIISRFRCSMFTICNEIKDDPVTIRTLEFLFEYVCSCLNERELLLPLFHSEQEHLRSKRVICVLQHLNQCLNVVSLSAICKNTAVEEVFKREILLPIRGAIDSVRVKLFPMRKICANKEGEKDTDFKEFPLTATEKENNNIAITEFKENIKGLFLSPPPPKEPQSVQNFSIADPSEYYSSESSETQPPPNNTSEENNIKPNSENSGAVDPASSQKPKEEPPANTPPKDNTTNNGPPINPPPPKKPPADIPPNGNPSNGNPPKDNSSNNTPPKDILPKDAATQPPSQTINITINNSSNTVHNHYISYDEAIGRFYSSTLSDLDEVEKLVKNNPNIPNNEKAKMMLLKTHTTENCSRIKGIFNENQQLLTTIEQMCNEDIFETKGENKPSNQSKAVTLLVSFLPLFTYYQAYVFSKIIQDKEKSKQLINKILESNMLRTDKNANSPRDLPFEASKICATLAENAAYLCVAYKAFIYLKMIFNVLTFGCFYFANPIQKNTGSLDAYRIAVRNFSDSLNITYADDPMSNPTTNVGDSKVLPISCTPPNESVNSQL